MKVAGPKNSRAILLLVCKDKPGLVSTVTSFIFKNGGNIVDSDQHTDLETGTFFMRLEWEIRKEIPSSAFQKSIAAWARKNQIAYELFLSRKNCRAAIFVSRYAHCLHDLLMRHELGEIKADIGLILSNHEDLKSVAEHFGAPFVCIPVDKKNKVEAEKQQLELLRVHKIDLIVLARYMQILSPTFVSAYKNRIINIHHSFLPAFIGSKPYHQAYARGVKVIGATSHYVTEDLDQGPIIAQSIVPVSHRDRLEDLVRKGRDQERTALAYAVRMHTEHRILTYKNKTIVFE